MKRLKSKLSTKLSWKIKKPSLNISKDEIKNEILTIGLFVFVIVTTFWLLDIVFGLLSDEMKFSEIKYVLVLIRDYVLWFVLGLGYMFIARKKQFNSESVIAFTALGSIYTAIKLYSANLGYVWIIVAEWIIITMAIYNIVKFIFSRLANPVME